ncbi:MAG: 3-isopropylmalate dehydratase large subunit [Betaproteobacteria bacterium]
MTMAEKILARASGRESVRPGEFVTAKVDLAMANDAQFPQACKALEDIGLKRVFDPGKVVVIIDHWVPANTPMVAEMHRGIRAKVKELGLRHFYDAGVGIEHKVIPEKGHALPGELIVGSDSHSTTYGALGAASTGIGLTELAYVMYTGKLWFQVPPSIRFNLAGKLGHGVAPKDLMLALLGKYTTQAGQYKSVEFAGPVADAMSMEGRLTLANISSEMGAKFALFAADATTLEYLRTRTDKPVQAFGPDPDAQYEAVHTIDCSKIEPQVAAPHKPDNVKNVSEFASVRVDQAFIGSCTNAHAEDLERAAAIMKGRKVAAGTRFLVIPASHEVMVEAMKNGSLAVLVEAGAMVGTPGCGPCAGGSTGVLGPGETGIASTNRNFKGRGGSAESFLYLASPETVAASAIEGRIADPRKYMPAAAK